MAAGKVKSLYLSLSLSPWRKYVEDICKKTQAKFKNTQNLDYFSPELTVFIMLYSKKKKGIKKGRNLSASNVSIISLVFSR